MKGFDRQRDCIMVFVNYMWIWRKIYHTSNQIITLLANVLSI
jgi:hypothetical protein